MTLHNRDLVAFKNDKAKGASSGAASARINS
jgi:hypothetical protein